MGVEIKTNVIITDSECIAALVLGIAANTDIFSIIPTSPPPQSITFHVFAIRAISVPALVSSVVNECETLPRHALLPLSVDFYQRILQNGFSQFGQPV